VHYWADLQWVHGLRCCGNITRMRNVSEYMRVLALCLVTLCVSRSQRKMSETDSDDDDDDDCDNDDEIFFSSLTTNPYR